MTPPCDLSNWPWRARPRGFTLIELLIAMTIGLVLTLIISTFMVQQESGRRAVTGGNDLTANAAYASYTLDRELRSAGSGFADGWFNAVGCPLLASRVNTQILPRNGAFPAPFASVPGGVRLAPVLIHAGAGVGGSDVLAVMAGSGGLAETWMPVQPTSTLPSQLRLANTIGLRAGDMVMLSEATRPCMFQQVIAGFIGGPTQPLNFGGNYAADVINGVALMGYSQANNAFLSVMGNVNGNQPRLQLIGLGANSTLFAYDLLRMDGLDLPQPLVEGVADIRALYGIADATGRLTGWAAPTGAALGIAALTAGTNVAQTTLRNIVAVRIGLVLRSDLIEREAVSPATLTLFDGMPGLAFTFNVPAAQQRQRFRTVEFTVPLRNVQLTY